jgi:hypothetical protein
LMFLQNTIVENYGPAIHLSDLSIFSYVLLSSP